MRLWHDDGQVDVLISQFFASQYLLRSLVFYETFTCPVNARPAFKLETTDLRRSPAMECVSIQSRLIASAAYFRRDGKLCVWFNSGRCAWHDNVSEAMFRNLAKAESAGLYYSNHIARQEMPRGRRAGAITRLAAFALLSILMVGLSDAITYSGTGKTDLTASDFGYYANAGGRWHR
jgi:hypothetical protein